MLAELKALVGLKPKNESAEALAQSLASATEQHAEAVARIDALSARRVDALLAEDAAGVQAIEREIATTEAQRDRLALLVAQLPDRIASMRLREGRAAVDREIAEIEAEAARVTAMIQREYGPLAEKIAAMLRAERDVAERVNALVGKVDNWRREGIDVDGLAIPATPSDRYAHPGMGHSLCRNVHLPALNGVKSQTGDEPFWPAASAGRS